MSTTKNYKVLSEWFTRTDSLGHKISTWCKKVDDENVICSICAKNIYCCKKGFAALSQHAVTALHTKNAQVKLGNQQLLLLPTETQSCTTNKPSEVKLHFENEASIKAELIWALKSVQCNMATNVCEDLKEVFNAMFPGAVPEKFHLGRTKLSYLITEALGPYFLQEIISDVQGSPFSLLYDETINNAGKKELQLMLRFWSESEKQVVSRHLNTSFLGHATADDVSEEINKVLNNAGLSKKSILMLGSDGPNVNKKIWRLMNEELIEDRGKGLINVGTCSLHLVHNAFLRGSQEFGETASELICDVYNFFNNFPSRWEDYEKIQFKAGIKNHNFIKHVSSRWLTLGPAAERVLEQWPAIEEYFSVFIPQNEKKLMNTEKYKRIIKSLKYKDIKIEFSFIKESSELFSSFVKLFQRSEPLIHLLYEELKKLLIKVLGRISKCHLNDTQFISTEDLCKPLEVNCGERTLSLISALKESDKLNVLRKIQRHYMEAYNYLIKKDCLTNVKVYKSLQVKEISSSSSLENITSIAKSLSFLEIDELIVRDEWRLLQAEVNTLSVEPTIRIDHFWRSIIYEKTAVGDLKYPSISKLTKACLCLSHGNSDVERGFSVSSRVLSEEKSSMSERCLNARLLVKDALTKYKNVSEVPITKQLLKLALSANKSYKNYLEEQKKLKETVLRLEKEKEERMKKEKEEKEKISLEKVKIDVLERKAKVEAEEKKQAQESADGLLKEARQKLILAIKKNDIVQIKIAEGMLEGAEKLREKEREHDKKESKILKIVNKRKSNMIDSYIVKEPKQKKL